MRIDDISLEDQYAKARNSLAQIVEESDDVFLEELGIPGRSVRSVDEWVRVKFKGNSKDSYILESNLGLYSTGNRRIGYYCLPEDERGNFVDDFLVFE